MNLRHTLRAGVAAIAVAAVIAPAGSPAGAATASIDVRVAQADGFSRVEFRGAPEAKVTRAGQVLTFAFPRDADPDISRLRTSPPRWIKTAEKRHAGGKLQVIFTLTDDADLKTGSADGAAFLNVFAKPPPTAAELAAARAAIPEPVRPNPIPAGGVVHMASHVDNSQVQFSFTWANPAGAAVFRRGDAVWVVFDAPATLDVGHAPRGLVQYSAIAATKGADYAAVRIEAAHGVPVFATAIGNTWTIALGPGDEGQPSVVRVQRDDADGPATLKAAVAGITRIVQMTDPQAGDTLSVVTALGPSKGLPTRRDYAQVAVLPSVQGLAVESHIDDLKVTRDGDIVRIGRDLGLALSPNFLQEETARLTVDAPKPAAMPGLIDTDWARTGPKGFLARYQQLLNAATVESANKDKAAPVGARLALARFLVGSDLSFEAIGVLNDALRAHPSLSESPEFRGLRGVARVMARRYKEAEADFSAPVLSEDRSSALWRGYIASQMAQWSEARAQFVKGAEAFNMFPAVWKARFARGDATAAMAQGDLAGAQARIQLALADKTDVYEELATRLVQARIIEQQGHKDRALRMYAAIATVPREALSSPALLRATQIRLETGKVTPVQAANIFDGLRYRWRGDGTELETIRALGQLYLNQGRYREALEALRSAGTRLPDLPEALQLRSDLNVAFRSLFLDGAADGLEPVQALGLFNDFGQDLTPPGADGDLMVRKLVRRLVDVDLLDQAADLLKYQADNRLDGVARAQVATDLARIYLMNKKPEKAIEAINGSRTTVLPAALNADRRLLEARAWMGVGRYDSALEIIEKDTTREGQDLRAEIVWKQKDWPKAGPQFEKALGARWKDPTALSADDEGKLLRAGVAYSLAGDDAALTRLSGQYGRFFDAAHNPEALRIALTGVSTNRLSVADFGRVSADNEAFAGWVEKMKVRFRTAAAAPATGAVKTAGPAAVKPAAPAKQAQAAGTGPAKG